MLAPSPGSLVGNPPPRRGAPGDDLVGLGSEAGKCGQLAAASVHDPGERRKHVALAVAERSGVAPDVPSHAPHGHSSAPLPEGAPSALVAGLPRTSTDGLAVATATGRRSYANLDHAASTPALDRVLDAVAATMASYASVHRGKGYASAVTTQWYDESRDEVGRFFGVRPDDHVIFTRNTTDSWSLLAHALPADTTVVVFASEHHSTLLPWGPDRTITVPVPRSIAGGLRDLAAALKSVTTRHTLVVIAGASNVTGEVWPLAEVVALAHERGARVAVDAAQLAPHRRVDLATSGVDYVAVSGHKLYAPYGTGVLAGRADWLDAAEPYLAGGGATASVTGEEVAWVRGPERHEGGSPNVVGAIALAAACSTLTEHWADVALLEHTLAQRLRLGLAAIPGVRLHSMFGEGSDRVAVVAFTIDGLDSALVATALSVEYGIGVRDGKFCAHQLVDALLADHPTGGASSPLGNREGYAVPGNSSATSGCDAPGIPVTAVRASLGLATRLEHVERLVAAVRRFAAHGPALRYAASADGWVTRDLEGIEETAPQRPW